ncbi:pyridoxal phosphate-dependent aminotransferase [Lachnospiraceae bacterium BX10]|uniref:cysteine-S-conjugate beta-lyase n=1 Tax=Enterocloster hominis (ex Liu et al. 2021) TaxID=2763663 RepID=A0ABR7NS42_9FIRM|nr:MalY/PatB family protein [Enterocloster hominis]MBC8598942.1 pyridoxal phosphate-dependent aminotransferase [Enterocloster hominis]
MKYNFDEIIDRTGTSATKMESLPKGCPDDALPLWVADMDFACAEPILKALHERIDKKIFGYTMYDTDECLGAVLNWYKKRYGWEEQKENLFFCGGIVSAYAVLLNLLTKEGEGVVIQRPIYYPFTMKANSNGRQIVDSPLIYADGNYTIDFDDLDKKMAEPNNKVLVFCSPHNPAGRVWTEEEIRKVVDICKKYDKWIICDEIHCDLLRCGMTFHPILKVAPDYADRIAVCTAPSKTFNLAGMKTSNIVIHNKELQAAWKELIGGKLSMNGAGTLGLTAMIAAYNEGEEWLEQLKEYLDGNFAYIDAFLKEHLPKAHMVPSEGTYLAWIDFNGYVDGDAEKLEEIMQKKARVALDEGYIFGDAGRGFERINIATPRSVVEDCMDRILKAFKEEKLV